MHACLDMYMSKCIIHQGDPKTYPAMSWPRGGTTSRRISCWLPPSAPETLDAWNTAEPMGSWRAMPIQRLSGKMPGDQDPRKIMGKP